MPRSACSLCERPVFARGWCNPHYKRWYRYGDPEAIGRKPERQRFEDRIKRSPEGCWSWTGSHMVNGYAKFSADGRRQVLAHRYAYELWVREIPDGLVIDHLCRNRGCVNPDHLEAVTNEENLRRGAGYAIRNGMRTACVNGHEYTPENTYVNKRGIRICRQCSRDRYHKTKQRENEKETI